MYCLIVSGMLWEKLFPLFLFKLFLHFGIPSLRLSRYSCRVLLSELFLKSSRLEVFLLFLPDGLCQSIHYVALLNSVQLVCVAFLPRQKTPRSQGLYLPYFWYPHCTPSPCPLRGPIINVSIDRITFLVIFF